MALDRIHLRKLLKLLLLKDSVRSTAIRRDALEVMKRQDEGPGKGGDFHVPFWSAAKAHAAGKSNLKDDVDAYIEKTGGGKTSTLACAMVF